MSRRASLFTKEAKENPDLKKKPRVRFPDELVFLDSIKENDVAVMGNMLRRVSVKIDINAIGESGMTPLHQAIIEDNLAAVQLLVNTEADINKPDEDSWTPLHAACANGFTEVARFLLAHGADRNALTDDGERPYDLIEPDDMETVRVMLQHYSISGDHSDGDSTLTDDEEEETEGAHCAQTSGKTSVFENGDDNKDNDDEDEDDDEFLNSVWAKRKFNAS